MTQGKRANQGTPGEARSWNIPPAMQSLLKSDTGLLDEEAFRNLLVSQSICAADQAPIMLELYGSLQIKTGCHQLPLRANTIGEALTALKKICPEINRILPSDETLAEHYRFSINGGEVFTDLDHPLQDQDTLILFSASVGG